MLKRDKGLKAVLLNYWDTKDAMDIGLKCVGVIVWVATLAGAHEFIIELQGGYDTMVDEHGSALSGGHYARLLELQGG